MRPAFARALLEAATGRDDLYVVTGDAGLGVLDDFAARYPTSIANLGVAEQNAIGFAAGLALGGRRVVVYNIIPFVLYRCYEQVRNDVCYQELPVVLVGTGAGVAYAPAGMTHYALEDLALAASLPNLRVFSPCDPLEAEAAVRAALEDPGPVYVRLGKSGEPRLRASPVLDARAPAILSEGADAALVFHGGVGTEVVAAADRLQGEGIACRVVSVPQVQPLDADRLLELCAGVGHVVCVEEHFAGSGLGCRLALLWAERRPGPALYRHGVPDRFVHEVMHQASLRRHFGLSADAIAERVRGLVSRGV